MSWKSSRSPQATRGLSERNRGILDKAIHQADQAAKSHKPDALDHGVWLNVRPDPIDFRDQIYQPGLVALASRRAPPAELAGIPVRNQGFLGSCTGMALAVAVDLLQRRRETLIGSASEPPPVSARMLYEMGRVYDLQPDDGLQGSSVRGVIRGFFHNGVCREIEELDDPLLAPPNEWRFTIDRARDASRVRLGTYARLKHVLLDYHSALNEVGVIIVSTFLHEGWRLGATLDSRDDKERWRIRWDGSQSPLGGHAVAIVGYDEQGFLVRNSWGEDWSHWQNAYAGVAHWSYDDWQKHVMDAWVIRLGVSGSHDARAIGGRFAVTDMHTAPSRGSPPRILVNGHYLNVKDGRLEPRPPYNCDLSSIRETAGLLQKTTDYDHLLIAVDSGLDDLDTMVQRALALTPHLKDAGIYPVFVWWREGCFDQASEMLEDRARRLVPKTGGLPELGSLMLEAFAREFMQPFWRTFEGEVERAFTRSDRKRGQAWPAIRSLLAAARDRERPLRVHALAHSAGALWFGELCRRLVEGEADAEQGLALPVAGIFDTVSLLAPICSRDLFTNSTVRRLWAGHGEALGIYTLRQEHDLEDRVGAYQGSFLRLAQRVFPIDGSIPDGNRIQNKVLGDEKIAKGTGRRSDAKWYPVDGQGTLGVKSNCRTHRGLSSDIRVLTHVLGRIIAKSDKGATALDLPAMIPGQS